MSKPVNPESLSHEYRQQIQDLRDYQKMPGKVNFKNRIKKISLEPKGKKDQYGIIGVLRGKP